MRVDPWGQPSIVGRWILVFAEALYHSVVCVGHPGCCLFLCLVGCPGNYIYYFAFAVEGDNFYLIFFEAAVCIEGDAANVCHGFEVFEGLLLCAGARLIFTSKKEGSGKGASAKTSRNILSHGVKYYLQGGDL